MPRIRTIKPKFWDDLKLSRISRDARLTFIALWNFSDDNGVIMSEPIWLKSKVFPYDQIQLKQFEIWLSELTQHGFISLFSYENDKFYYLPNFVKHQVINRPNVDDVFVPKGKLEKALQSSMINHGLFNDESPPERKGKEEERKGKEEAATPVDIIAFPFESENFKKIWARWKLYKNEQFKFKFKSASTEQGALNELTKLSDGIEQNAEAIILQSIANGWKGFFELKNNLKNATGNSQKFGKPDLNDYAAELAANLRANTGKG